MEFSEFYTELKNVMGEKIKELPPVDVKVPCKKIFMWMTLSFSDETPEADYKKTLNRLKEKESDEQALLDVFKKNFPNYSVIDSEQIKKYLKDLRNAYLAKEYLDKHPYFNEVIYKLLNKGLKKKIDKEFKNNAQIKKYLKLKKKNGELKKFKSGDIDTSGLMQIIRDYIVEYPYFTEVINELSDDTKKKIYEELNNDAQIKEYLEEVKKDVLEKVKKYGDVEFQDRAKNGIVGLAKIIRDYIVEYPYFTEVIGRLLTKVLKKKIDKEFNHFLADDQIGADDQMEYIWRVQTLRSGVSDVIGLAKIIRPYLVEHPYFTKIIKKLLSAELISEEQNNKIYEEFNHIVVDAQIKEYLNYLKFWSDQNDDKFWKYAHGSNDIIQLAKIIRDYIVEYPYFTEVINELSDDTKQKIFDKFKAYLPTISLDGSLDFLGQDIADLLRNIIRKAADPDLIKFEELWKKERESLLKMVFYPMLYQLFRYAIYPHLYFIKPKESKYASVLDKSKKYNEKIDYSIKLEIRDNKKCSIIRDRGHRSTDFLVKLFFFIAEKEKIYLNNKLDYLLKDIPAECIEVAHLTLLPKLNFNEEEDRTAPFVTHSFFLLPDRRKYSDDCIKKFFKDEQPIFKDVKHILEFKDSIGYCKDSFVWINLDPLAEFIDYYNTNSEIISKSVVRQDDYWKEKSKSDLFLYINKKLKTQEMSPYFKELNRYFLKKTDYPEFPPVS